MINVACKNRRARDGNCQKTQGHLTIMGGDKTLTHHWGRRQSKNDLDSDEFSPSTLNSPSLKASKVYRVKLVSSTGILKNIHSVYCCMASIIW